MDLIKVNILSFNYPTKKDVLTNINFKVEEGTFTCIVGENGSREKYIAKMYFRFK